MSCNQTTQWKEAAFENFEQALAEGNYSLCKDIIADVQDVDLAAGRELNEMLRNAPLEAFTNKSPIQRHDL